MIPIFYPNSLMNLKNRNLIWEETKMITEKNPSMSSTAEAIFVSTANEDILEQCRRREDAIAHEKYQAEQLKTLSSKLNTANATIASLSDEVTSLSDENARLKKLLAENGIKS